MLQNWLACRYTVPRNFVGQLRFSIGLPPCRMYHHQGARTLIALLIKQSPFFFVEPRIDRYSARPMSSANYNSTADDG